MISPFPKPRLFPRPNPDRLPRRRKAMTIAAGIICTDGILVCADSEVTSAVSKRQRDKIYAFKDHLLLTGSGNGDFIKMAFDKLSDEYKSSRPANPSDAREIAEKLVWRIHRKHIFSFYQPNDPGRPTLDLIIASRCQDDELALVRTRDTTAIRCGRYDATGSGEDLFEYWAQLFYRARATMDVISYLALFILREVKRNVIGCGGESHVSWLPKDKNVPVKWRLFNEEKILAGFPESAVEILIQCRDIMSTTDNVFDATIKTFVKAVRGIRESEKHKVGMQKFVNEHPEIL